MSDTNTLVLRTMKVLLCGRIHELPFDRWTSLSSISRELCARLEMREAAPLKLTDRDGVLLRNDSDLLVAMKEGRSPLQAQPSLASLPGIETLRSEVEAKKEEWSKYQWEIVVDQMQGLQVDVDAVKESCASALQQQQEEQKEWREEILASVKRETAKLQSARDDYAEAVRQYKEDHVWRDTMLAAIARETTERQSGLVELQAKLQGLFMKERYARERTESETDSSSTARDSGQIGCKAELNNVGQWRHNLDVLKRLHEKTDRQREECVAVGERLKAVSDRIEGAWAALEPRMQRVRTAMEDGMSSVERESTAGRLIFLEIRCAELDVDVKNMNESYKLKFDETATSFRDISQRLVNLDLGYPLTSPPSCRLISPEPCVRETLTKTTTSARFHTEPGPGKHGKAATPNQAVIRLQRNRFIEVFHNCASSQQAQLSTLQSASTANDATPQKRCAVNGHGRYSTSGRSSSSQFEASGATVTPRILPPANQLQATGGRSNSTQFEASGSAVTPRILPPTNQNKDTRSRHASPGVSAPLRHRAVAASGHTSLGTERPFAGVGFVGGHVSPGGAPPTTGLGLVVGGHMSPGVAPPTTVLCLVGGGHVSPGVAPPTRCLIGQPIRAIPGASSGYASPGIPPPFVASGVAYPPFCHIGLVRAPFFATDQLAMRPGRATSLPPVARSALVAEQFSEKRL